MTGTQPKWKNALQNLALLNPMEVMDNRAMEEEFKQNYYWAKDKPMRVLTEYLQEMDLPETTVSASFRL